MAVEILGDERHRQKMGSNYRYQTEAGNPVYRVNFSGHMYIRGVSSDEEAERAAETHLGFDRGGLSGAACVKERDVDLTNLQFAKTTAESGGCS